MIDREKVIKGLECCIKRDPDDKTRCDECPYGGACLNRLKSDALALLKAQQPRVMTLEEVHEGDVMWFDSPGNFIMRPVICVMHDKGDSSYLVFAWQYGTFTWRISDYGIGWRCWASRPTDEQREATPWQE